MQHPRLNLPEFSQAQPEPIILPAEIPWTLYPTFALTYSFVKKLVSTLAGPWLLGDDKLRPHSQGTTLGTWRAHLCSDFSAEDWSEYDEGPAKKGVALRYTLDLFLFDWVKDQIVTPGIEGNPDLNSVIQNLCVRLRWSDFTLILASLCFVGCP